ncbi:unnamed protein product [Rodentolepis nana]|uniref:HCO3_cotransp domain-containing protein n=1 Tax=Rodentolepis nana TaxID=102285 RepID=A0A0R3T5D9_RODNA|nr:unnamed protein product [Rodentolepis nana]
MYSRSVFRILLSQTIGGLLFGFTGGQPLTVLLTTAPLALYVKLIYTVTVTYDLEFYAFFGCVGLFNAGFLFIYAAFDAGRIMRWSTRSTEEIFAMFVSIAFLVEAYRDAAKEFYAHYIDCIPPSQCLKPSDLAMAKLANQYSMPNNHSLDPSAFSTASYNYSSIAQLLSPLAMMLNDSSNVDATASNATAVDKAVCKPEVAILYLLLLACTFWICTSMLNFTKT